MADPLRALPFPALERLLDSVPARRFFDETWERSPALLPATSTRAREEFRAPDWRDLARAVLALDPQGVELIRAGRATAAAAPGIEQAFAEGASVRVLQVWRGWPFLEELCRRLEWELGFKLEANLYVTPEGRQGLDAHADSHDVFVVQMAGVKDWEVFGSPYVLPLEHRAPLIFERGGPRHNRGSAYGSRAYTGRDVGEPALRCSLAPGDLLYLPRGFVHQAVAARGTSVHVTLGVHATTWADLLALAVAQESRGEPAGLRETLPPGATRVAAPGAFVEAELRRRGGRLLERLNGEALMLETAARFAAGREAGPAPAPFDRAGAYRLAPSAYLNFRADAIDVRSLRAPAEAHVFPSAFRPVFERLLRGEPVSRATAAPLTARSAEVLLQRLHAAQLLAPCP